MRNKLEIYKLTILVLTSIVAVLVMVLYTNSNQDTYRESSANQIPAYEINKFPVYDTAVQTTAQVQDDQSFASWKVSRKDMQTVLDWYVNRLATGGWIVDEVYPDSSDVKWIEATNGNYKAEVLLEDEDSGGDFYINVRVTN